jgi:hypothetical protein
MDAIKFETAAFLLMAVSLPLISFGAMGGTSLWVAGFGILVVATVIPPLLRFTDASKSSG